MLRKLLGRLRNERPLPTGTRYASVGARAPGSHASARETRPVHRYIEPRHRNGKPQSNQLSS